MDLAEGFFLMVGYFSMRCSSLRIVVLSNRLLSIPCLMRGDGADTAKQSHLFNEKEMEETMFTYNDIIVDCRKSLALLREAEAILVDLKKNMIESGIVYDKIMSAIGYIGVSCCSLDSQIVNSMADIRNVCEM